jgi:hypothetical protein
VLGSAAHAVCDARVRRLQAVVQTLSDAAASIGVFSNSQAAAYWGYHITRSSFFALQGIAGESFRALPGCKWYVGIAGELGAACLRVDFGLRRRGRPRCPRRLKRTRLVTPCAPEIVNADAPASALSCKGGAHALYMHARSRWQNYSGCGWPNAPRHQLPQGVGTLAAAGGAISLRPSQTM